MSIDNSKLIQALKDKRNFDGLSLRALSKKIDVSFSTLARIERGDGKPDNNSTLKILDWLGDFGRERGLSFENVAFVHFRAAKNVQSKTVEHLIHLADQIKRQTAFSDHADSEDEAESSVDYNPLSLSKPEMEEMAQRFRDSIGFSSDQPIPALQIEIEGVDVYLPSDVPNASKKSVDYLTNAGSHDWSAMSIPLNSDNTKWAIVRNGEHTIERQRVTYLEEFWHIYLGHRLTKVSKIGDAYGRSYEASEEHDAFYLASACLLPEDQVRDRVSKGESSKDIANTFGTSVELVDYRIKRLGLWGTYKGLQINLAQ